jgi:hypothetical protein
LFWNKIGYRIAGITVVILNNDAGRISQEDLMVKKTLPSLPTGESFIHGFYRGEGFLILNLYLNPAV